ncbi:hypothetical protein [Acinetobacter baumannii]|uniref:hypothetical protein n=1 Tax=Acinetobacter baumannii TaxID=470 RepID=UPI001053F435|nr:hypothetical protein [Acinetobacter baumannii]MBF6684191.1 hypothetical protein [Acinetobacter baumannii]MBF6693740.1 hypothetical protein [Acinetobacter baumannii]MBF6775030.1 hypothetical protein [Acinetobacter baumannii]TDA57414.1 hypothetical protein ETP77_12230 [Acinetobacter baumannii]
MAIAEELHVKSLIQPYSNSIIQAIKEAWSLWLQSPFFGKWSSRGRATFVWETALLHKDLKCKAPLIEPNLRRNLGKWST